VGDNDQLKEFMAVAAQPYIWQQTAREYVVHANYLLDWYDVSRSTPSAGGFQFTIGGPVPAMVLYAVAVENLLKAIRVALHDPPVVDGALSPHFKHHNLLAHAREAKVPLAPEESDLLGHLSDFMEAGRYPLPTAPGNAPRAWRFDFPGDVERVWALLERLEAVLRATGRDVLPAANLRERYRPPGYALPELM
jgi:hypothetical protein